MSTPEEPRSQQPSAQLFLSVPQAAETLGCSPGLLYQLIRGGDFPAVRLGAKKYLVPTRVITEIVEVVVASGGLVDIAHWKHGREAMDTHP